MRTRNKNSTLKKEHDPKSKIAFNSVYRATNILSCLSKGYDTVNDIASQCNLSMSTVHRLLKTLEQSKLVVCDAIKHRYYIGPLIGQLASNPLTTHKLLITFANDEMKRLAEVSEETVTLNIAVGFQGILIHEIQSKHVLRVAFGTNITGMMFPVHATPKVLLSQLSDTELEIVLKNLERYDFPDSFIANKEQLMYELRLIRQQGYIIHSGERTEGALALSAPVTNYIFPACISIVGYGNRALPKVSYLIEELKKSANIVSEHLRDYFNERE